MLGEVRLLRASRGQRDDLDSPYQPLLETSQRPGEHANEMHSSLHPLHQTQRNQEAQRLGGQPVSLAVSPSRLFHTLTSTPSAGLT